MLCTSLGETWVNDKESIFNTSILEGENIFTINIKTVWCGKDGARSCDILQIQDGHVLLNKKARDK